MRAYAIGFLLGFAAASITIAVVLYFALPQYLDEKQEFGRRQGYTDASIDMLHRITKTFGNDYQPADGFHPFLEVKASAVVVVVRNGVKTLRVYPN